MTYEILYKKYFKIKPILKIKKIILKIKSNIQQKKIKTK